MAIFSNVDHIFSSESDSLGEPMFSIELLVSSIMKIVKHFCDIQF